MSESNESIDLLVKLLQRCAKFYKNIDVFFKIFKLIDKKEKSLNGLGTWTGTKEDVKKKKDAEIDVINRRILILI
mgnify:CR=1 FL=1